MKSLTFTTYWLMVIAVVGGIHSQHSEHPAGNFQPISPELELYNSKISCQSKHHLSVAPASRMAGVCKN